MDQRPKCIAKNIKCLDENWLHAVVLGNGFLDIIPKAQETKEKQINWISLT